MDVKRDRVLEILYGISACNAFLTVLFAALGTPVAIGKHVIDALCALDLENARSPDVQSVSELLLVSP